MLVAWFCRLLLLFWLVGLWWRFYYFRFAWWVCLVAGGLFGLFVGLLFGVGVSVYGWFPGFGGGCLWCLALGWFGVLVGLVLDVGFCGGCCLFGCSGELVLWFGLGLASWGCWCLRLWWV